MRRPVAQAAEASPAAAFPDDDWVTLFPLVVEYLTDDSYEDGSRRAQSTMSLKFQDGMILASINDHDLSRGLYRTGLTVLDAVGAIQSALASGKADWRPWKRGGGKKG